MASPAKRNTIHRNDVVIIGVRTGVEDFVVPEKCPRPYAVGLTGG